MIPIMIVSLRHFLGWLVSVFRAREELVPREPDSPSAIAGSARAQPRRRLTALHKLFLAFRSCAVRADRFAPVTSAEEQ
jgi:hypothetical protein